MSQLPYSMTASEAQSLFDKQYITAQQIADHVGVSRVSVFNARKSGKLPNSIKLDSTFLWEREFIQPYMDSWKNDITVRSEAGE